MRFLKYLILIVTGLTINHFTLLYKIKISEKQKRPSTDNSSGFFKNNIHYEGQFNLISFAHVQDPAVKPNDKRNEWRVQEMELQTAEMFNLGCAYPGKNGELSRIGAVSFNVQRKTSKW